MAIDPTAKKLACALMLTLSLATGAAHAALEEGARIRLAVVGDSDSHSYHDRLRFSGNDGARGGAHHATTWQWTEALQRLRSGWIDQGEWAHHGSPGAIARAAGWVGLSARAPEKEDFRYNFAVSGARCESLMGGERQVPQLVGLMDEEPDAWRSGVVVIRIGVNSFGQSDSLERLATNPDDPELSGTITRCISAMREAVHHVHHSHPHTRVVLVGIFDNSNIGDAALAPRAPAALRNIATALDRYDDALRAMAVRDSRIAFFDDRAWFAALWGSRGPDGRPRYRDVNIGGRMRVSNTQGDAPSHAVLADGHAGSAWNALWARALVDLIDRHFGAHIPAVDEAELLALLQPGRHRDRRG
ncbi:hypothetical protein ACW5EG_09240 [Luteimonas sp. A611]